MNIRSGIKSIGLGDVMSLMIGGVIYGVLMYFLGFNESPWVVSTIVGGFIVSLPMMVICRTFTLR